MITKDLLGRILLRIVYSGVHSGEKKKRHDIKYFEDLYLWQFSYDGEADFWGGQVGGTHW